MSKQISLTGIHLVPLIQVIEIKGTIIKGGTLSSLRRKGLIEKASKKVTPFGYRVYKQLKKNSPNWFDFLRECAMQESD